MTLSKLSVQRKIAMGAFIAMLVFFGLQSFHRIGLDTIPKMDVPYVQIVTVYPGASPEEVEIDVAKRIEDTVASLDGLKHVTSTCMENVAGTTLEFVAGTDADMAIHQVRERLNLVVDDFPAGVKTPRISKININAIPVVTLYLTGTKSIDELYDYADKHLKDMLSSVPGVGEVRLHGGSEMQLHVILDRRKLAAANLTVMDIISKLKTENLKLPAGHLKENGREMALTFDAEFRDMQALREFEVGSVQGKRIYLGDIASIELKSKEIRQEAFLNDEPGVAVEVVKKAEANTVKVIDAIRKRFDQLQNGSFPGGMQLVWFKDDGAYIKASVQDAWQSVMMGIILTALLLFLFLHEPRSTFIISITMPVSVVITFFTMRLMNYTFDMMTLVSLGCSSGILVTNSVIVIENIFIKLRQGKAPAEAAATGTGEVVNAVCASALTNVVVFVPVALMNSVVGDLIGPFAGVMVIATLASLFVSFTLTPILASLFLSDRVGRKDSFWAKCFRFWDVGYDKISNAFNASMNLTKKYPGTAVVIGLALCIAAAWWAVPNIRLALVPFYDKNELSLTLEFPANFSVEESRRHTLEILQELQQEPYVEKTGTTVGYRNALLGQVSEGVNLSEITIILKPMGERENIRVLMDKIRQKLAAKRNLLFNLAMPAPTGGAGQELTCFIGGPDIAKLEQFAKEGAEILRRSGAASDIDTSVRTLKPRINLIPNRSITKNLNVPMTALGTSTVGYFEGVEAGSFKVGLQTYDIRIRAEEKDGFSQLENTVIGSLQGKPVTLYSVLKPENSPVAVNLMRQDKERSAWIYANSAPGYSLDSLMKILRKELAPKLPAGYHLEFTGQAEMMQEGTADFMTVFVTAIVLTFLLIAGIMESLWKPFLIMFTVPLGFIGMFFMLGITGTSFSMVGMLGAVMMIGIVVNNAILIMDEAGNLQKKGLSAHQAMLQAVQNKFRPIIMTSIASLIGMLPMAFGTGVGYEIRSSCGIGVVGGLFFSMLLTLYFIPALYFKLTKDR